MTLIANPTISVAGVCERDIDLLLLQEFVASGVFRDWFVTLLDGRQSSAGKLVHAARSATLSNGESDLELTFESEDGFVRRYLIENKISAGFQPRQAERYKERGESYVRRGACKAFTTVLVAPESYFGEALDRKGFDAAMTYEQIRDFLGAYRDERAHYLSYLLSKAIEKGSHGWQLVEDEPVTRFWRRYWEISTELAPELELREPGGKPSGSSFIYFQPVKLPSNVSLYHKVTHGNVDLQFSGMGNRTAELRAAYGGKLLQNMGIYKTNKSAVVRISVPKIDMTENTDTLEGRITEAVRMAQMLLEWFQENAEQALVSEKLSNNGLQPTQYPRG